MPAKGAAAGTDRYGDPLPDGAVARLGTVRFRHANYISSIVYAPDGRTLVSGSADGTVRVWDVKSGKEMLRVRNFAECSFDVAVAPDGKTAACPGNDNSVHLWDMTTGKDIRLFRPAKDASPQSVAFSPDGKMLAAAIYDDSLCVWGTATGKLVWQVPEQEGDEVKRGFGSLCFSPDGKYVTAGGWGGGFVWEASSGKLHRRLGRSEDHPAAVAFSPDSACLAADGDDNIIRLWNVASGREVQQVTGHKKSIPCIAFAPDGKRLLSPAWTKTSYAATGTSAWRRNACNNRG